MMARATLGFLMVVGSAITGSAIKTPTGTQERELAPKPFLAGSVVIAPDPFADDTTEISSGPTVETWKAIRLVMAQDHDMVESCLQGGSDACAPAMTLLGIVSEAKQQQTRRALIGHINRAINLAIKPVPSTWTGPLDVFKRLDGDCKAYGVAKYFALREAGLAPDKVRAVVVHVARTGDDHLVVAARTAGQWLILDNRTMVMNGDSQVPQYAPLLAMDYRGVRTYTAAVAVYQGRTSSRR